MSFTAWVVGEVIGVATFSGILGMLIVPVLRRMAFPKFKETYLSDFLPFYQIGEDQKTLVCRDETLVRIIELKGVDIQTTTSGEQEFYFSRKQAFFDAMAERGGFFRIITRREKVVTEDKAYFDHGVLQRIHDKWQAQFQHCYQTTHYLLIQSKKRSELEDLTTVALEHLSAFKPEILGNREEREGTTSSPLLTFLGSLINIEKRNIYACQTNISEAIISSQVLFHSQEGLIEIREAQNACFHTVLSLKGWGDSASEHILTEILHLPFEFEILHYFKSFKRLEASSTLRYRLRQENLLFPNIFKNEEFDTATSNIEAGNCSLFDHQLTFFIKGETPEKAQHNLDEIRKTLLNFGIKPVQEFDTIEWLWFSRYPSYDIMSRPRSLLSNNLASFVSFDGNPSGYIESDWGRGPLRYFKTSSGNAYALQVHISDRKEALAHSLTIAPSESGKTTLFQHLIGGALRHKDLRAYIFDRFNGTKIFTHAVGGSYIDLSSKNALHLNPLQCADMSENRTFLTQFLLRLGGCADDTSLEIAGRAVDLLFKTPLAARSLKSIYGVAFDTKSDLKLGLKKWVEGPYSKLLNGDTDSLDFNAARLMSFEMTDLQRDPVVAAALTEYILHRIRSQVRGDASPHMIMIDEAALMLEDPLFARQTQVLFREHRKLRGSINICFQDAQALFKSGIGESILNQCQTLFLFQNLNATQEDYVPLNLTSSEWAFVKGVSALSKHIQRGVLVKKGRESIILNVDMRGLGSLLNIYKSGSEPLKLMRELQAKFQGEGAWVEHYLDSF